MNTIEKCVCDSLRDVSAEQLSAYVGELSDRLATAIVTRGGPRQALLELRDVVRLPVTTLQDALEQAAACVDIEVRYDVAGFGSDLPCCAASCVHATVACLRKSRKGVAVDPSDPSPKPA